MQNNLKPIVIGETKEIAIAGATSSEDTPASVSGSINANPAGTDNLNSAPETPTNQVTTELTDTASTTVSSGDNISQMAAPMVSVTPTPSVDQPLSQGLLVIKDVTPDSKYYTAIHSLLEK